MIDNESWRISIEQSSGFIAEQIVPRTVQAIFEKYNATCIDDLDPVHFSEVYNELSAVEADLRN